ncbi:gibberellin 20 oxidase 1-D-like [Abrus precatorius]|uniref:Gibberellin 20 oxidase 1-D-like n=1 Tax=Abrus precatorius TaxID=3816 RepID=A0A8B8MHZ7_ABRPR|nr:gibberellin 20 oxidase 1-D-like [Abrus precatorius]
MESGAAAVVVSPSSKGLKDENENERSFDLKLLHKEADIPKQFIWSASHLVKGSSEKLDTPFIDLKAIKGDEAAMATAAELVRKACMKHGFFEVTNHGVDLSLINATYQEFDSIFKLPLNKKLGARKNPLGYSCGLSDRFSSNLPWKEIFTYRYNYLHHSDSQVVDFFNSIFHEDFQGIGLVNQKYCEAIKKLSMDILELLAISLGVDRSHFQRFFEDCEGIVRGNSYPPCKNFNLTFGVGPHCDPTSITILHQDQVGGLEVFVDGKWLAVPPRSETPDAFVINIGDTFTALSNGIYKSCLHRVLVNEEVERKSLTFFMNPRGDKTVRPPNNLFENEEQRKYPDFKWSELYEYTQKRQRADAETLPNFVTWLRASKPSNF